jgi:hypothetical protein
MVERNTPMATKRKKSQGLDAAEWDIDTKKKRLKNEIIQNIAVQGITANRRRHPLF